MFERFTDRARRVIVLAQEEARLLDHNYIGTEHLLLGMVNEADGVAALALEACGVQIERARAEVLRIVGRGTSTPSGHIPFTPWAKKSLERALREALELGHSYIGTEHLLLGLLDAHDREIPEILDGLQAPPSEVRDKVLELLGTEAPRASGERRGVQIVPSRSPLGQKLGPVVRAVQELTGRDPTVVPHHDPAAPAEAAADRFRRRGTLADAVVFVLGGDDLGMPRTADGSDPASLRPRASQDTIYHLGWFHGLLGRDLVIVLVDEGVEVPTDIGVPFIVLEAAGAWRPALDAALRRAGVAVDPGESA